MDTTPYYASKNPEGKLTSESESKSENSEEKKNSDSEVSSTDSSDPENSERSLTQIGQTSKKPTPQRRMSKMLTLGPAARKQGFLSGIFEKQQSAAPADQRRKSMLIKRTMTSLRGVQKSTQSIDNTRYNEQFMKGLKQMQKKLISERPKRQQLYYIFHMIINQRKFSYNTFNAIRYFLCCRVCRNKSSLNKIKSGKQDLYLDRGTDKLSRDLDIVNILDMVKGYHVMKQVLFSQDDRFLLKLQRRDMIHSSSTEDNDNDNEMDLAFRD